MGGHDTSSCVRGRSRHAFLSAPFLTLVHHFQNVCVRLIPALTRPRQICQKVGRTKRTPTGMCVKQGSSSVPAFSSVEP